MSDVIRPEDVRWRLRRYIKESHGSAKQYAFLNGVTPAYISGILTGRKAVPDWMLEEIGLAKEVRYVTTYRATGEPQ